MTLGKFHHIPVSPVAQLRHKLVLRLSVLTFISQLSCGGAKHTKALASEIVRYVPYLGRWNGIAECAPGYRWTCACWDRQLHMMAGGANVV